MLRYQQQPAAHTCSVADVVRLAAGVLPSTDLPVMPVMWGTVLVANLTG